MELRNRRREAYRHGCTRPRRNLGETPLKLSGEFTVHKSVFIHFVACATPSFPLLLIYFLTHSLVHISHCSFDLHCRWIYSRGAFIICHRFKVAFRMLSSGSRAPTSLRLSLACLVFGFMF